MRHPLSAGGVLLFGLYARQITFMQHRRKGIAMPEQSLLGPKLLDVFTPEQIEELRAEMVPSSQAKIVRFQLNGQTLTIENGRLQPKGINVIYQTHYWNFAKATAEKIALALKVKAVFSD